MSIVVDAPARKVTALNPMGFPPKITRKTAAPRPETLDGKTVYLVDCRFDDSIELLKQVQGWFADHMPSVTTKLVSLSAYYGHDDPQTWERIKADGHAAIVGVGHCSTCAPAVATHAITLDTKYGIPSVALHTDKFEFRRTRRNGSGRRGASGEHRRRRARASRSTGTSARQRARGLHVSSPISNWRLPSGRG